MTQCIDLFLLDGGSATNGTLLAVGQAGFRTGCCLTGYGFFLMTQCIDLFLLDGGSATNTTLLTLGQTGLGTGCCLTGNSFLDMSVQVDKVVIFRNKAIALGQNSLTVTGLGVDVQLIEAGISRQLGSTLNQQATGDRAAGDRAGAGDIVLIIRVVLVFFAPVPDADSLLALRGSQDADINANQVDMAVCAHGNVLVSNDRTVLDGQGLVHTDEDQGVPLVLIICAPGNGLAIQIQGNGSAGLTCRINIQVLGSLHVLQQSNGLAVLGGIQRILYGSILGFTNLGSIGNLHRRECNTGFGNDLGIAA